MLLIKDNIDITAECICVGFDQESGVIPTLDILRVLVMLVCLYEAETLAYFVNEPCY